jgi:hypothetical protein
MGMFDYLRSSYDLGEQFTNTRLQTKDIEDGIGGTMTQYWISPDGYLYVIDYTHTQNLKLYEPGDDGYDEKHQWRNFEWIPNGQHGKIRVHPITKYIEVYPENWKGDWVEWPRLKLHFRYGKLQDYEDITGR